MPEKSPLETSTIWFQLIPECYIWMWNTNAKKLIFLSLMNNERHIFYAAYCINVTIIVVNAKSFNVYAN